MPEEVVVNDRIDLRGASHTINEIARESLSTIPELTDQELNASKYSVTFKHNDTVTGLVWVVVGNTIPTVAAPEGYHWKDVPEVMPAEDLVVVSEADPTN